MRWPRGWWRALWNDPRDDKHADPHIERESAELYGRLETLCEQLEEALDMREHQLNDVDGEPHE